jgi:hypothetical protein
MAASLLESLSSPARVAEEERGEREREAPRGWQPSGGGGSGGGQHAERETYGTAFAHGADLDGPSTSSGSEWEDEDEEGEEEEGEDACGAGGAAAWARVRRPLLELLLNAASDAERCGLLLLRGVAPALEDGSSGGGGLAGRGRGGERNESGATLLVRCAAGARVGEADARGALLTWRAGAALTLIAALAAEGPGGSPHAEAKASGGRGLGALGL